MIVLTDTQARVVHRLLTCILLNETYQLSDVEDALVWTSPETVKFSVPSILCGREIWRRKLCESCGRVHSAGNR